MNFLKYYLTCFIYLFMTASFAADFNIKTTKLSCVVSGVINYPREDVALSRREVFVTIEEISKISRHITIDGPQDYRSSYSSTFSHKLKDPYYSVSNDLSDANTYYIIYGNKTQELELTQFVKIDRTTGFLQVSKDYKKLGSEYYSSTNITGECRSIKNINKF